jgi:hypothetical protein
MPLLIKKRYGLLITAQLTQVTNCIAERNTAECMLGDFYDRHRIMLGVDKAHDTRGFVQFLRILNALSEVAKNCQVRNSPNDGLAT